MYTATFDPNDFIEYTNDGDGFFKIISKIVCDVEDNYEYVREEIIKELENNPLTKVLVDSDYLGAMASNGKFYFIKGTPASLNEIYIASKLYKLNILLIDYNSGRLFEYPHGEKRLCIAADIGTLDFMLKEQFPTDEELEALKYCTEQ